MLVYELRKAVGVPKEDVNKKVVMDIPFNHL